MNRLHRNALNDWERTSRYEVGFPAPEPRRRQPLPVLIVRACIGVTIGACFWALLAYSAGGGA